MKRYVLSIVLTLFIVISIGTYYIQASIKLPDFRLETVEGDAEFASNLSVYTQFGERGSRTETILINTVGSHYENQESVFRRSHHYWYRGFDEIDQIIEEHRKFMRGKQIHAAFYNSDSFLIYANIVPLEEERDEYTPLLKISRLDKQTKQTIDAVIEVPDDHLYERGYILDIQLVDERIHIIAYYHLAASYRERQLVRHEIDVNTLEMLQSEVLMDVGEHENLMFVEDNITVPSEFVVFQKTHVYPYEEEVSDQIHADEVTLKDMVAREFYILHLPTDDIITPPGEVLHFATTMFDDRWFITSFTGEKIYMAKQIDRGLQLLEYDIVTAETKQHDIEITNIDRLYLKNGYFYVFAKEDVTDHLPVLIIFDASSGERLYKGKIALHGSKPNHWDPLDQLDVIGLVIHE